MNASRHRSREDDGRGHDSRRNDEESKPQKEHRRSTGLKEGSRRRHDRRDRSRSRDGGRDKYVDKKPGPIDEKAKGASNGRRIPLPLEDLVKKRQAEAVQASRPVFLTKEQRARLALDKRQQETDAQRMRLDAMRQELARAAGHGAVVEASTSHRNLDRDRRLESSGSRGQGIDKMHEKELEIIKQQYLGEEQPRKRRFVRVGERSRFQFDWDASDDTTKEENPLFQDLQKDAVLLFGRGFRAGIDRREQKKAAVEIEAATIARSRENGDDKLGYGTRDVHKRRKAALEGRTARANTYDAGDMRIDTHWSDKPREAMSERDWRIFREDFNISYKGSVSGSSLPIRDWDEAHLPAEVRRGINRVGYAKPSPIQMAAIPLGMQQRDVIGVAETGSGKTAAFVLPMLTYIMKQPRMAGNPDIEAEGPYAIVLAPTRELAQQIEEEARSLAHYTGFRVVSVVGGQSIEEQGFALRKGCEIVVATPGRLVDCIERRYAVLNQCNYVVLDEADRMIDMGFEPQVMKVLDAMPSSNLKPENEDEKLEEDRIYRTTYMFSATMPPAVERLARKYLRNPVVVNIGTAGKATENVTQRVKMMKENEKNSALSLELQSAGDDALVIVFSNTQKKCEQVGRTVESFGYPTAMLHGGKSQEQREESIKAFRDGRCSVLVATDVAGRGIDVPNVSLVINYDMPNSIEAYTHRIGRTGRAGRKGEAMTFLTLQDCPVFFDLKKFLEESGANIPKELASHEAARQKPGGPGSRPVV